MIIKTVTLDFVGVKLSQYPKDNKKEIIFVGKSNVGKSSLLNALIQRKKLARTSSSPGKTRTINFYHVNHAFYFVDLPGYGYAKAPTHEIESWANMIEEYFQDRMKHTDIFLFLLIDLRHDLGKSDLQMLEFLEFHHIPYQMIGTKADKLKPMQKKKNLQEIEKKHQTKAIAFSSVTKEGKEEIERKIEQFLSII